MDVTFLDVYILKREFLSPPERDPWVIKLIKRFIPISKRGESTLKFSAINTLRKREGEKSFPFFSTGRIKPLILKFLFVLPTGKTEPLLSFNKMSLVKYQPYANLKKRNRPQREQLMLSLTSPTKT